jgi:hypothetical protein
VLADDDMVAGPHRLTWSVGKTVPSGMYFYKVRADESVSTGKLIRVD